MTEHDKIVELCKKKAKTFGWTVFSIAEIEHELTVCPDLMLWRDDRETCAIEVKAESKRGASYTRRELIRGIGQCAYYLLHKVNPYLVVPEKFSRETLEICEHTPWLGIIIYTKEGELTVSHNRNIFTFIRDS